MDRLFDNASHLNNNFQFDFHMNYQTSLFMEQQQHQDQSHYQQQEVSPDGSSSPSSFMCLSKPSYENNNSSDFEGSGSDRLNDNDNDEHPNHKIPKIIKRAIYKNYEPITDNGITYNYHDDPSEYKKARKRVQNRVSATRIRGKNKNFVEELKVEVDDLRDEITQLKTQNNVLTSENALLKQQITFMERLLMGGAGKAATAPEVTIEQLSRDTKIDIHPVNQNNNNIVTINNKQEVASYSRAAPSSGRLKKHTAYLGIMTILLCISNIMSQGAQAKSIFAALYSSDSKVQLYTPFQTGSSTNIGGNSELSIIHHDHDANALVRVDPGSWTNVVVVGFKTLFAGIYVLYAIYVLSLAHQKYVHKQEKK